MMIKIYQRSEQREFERRMDETSVGVIWLISSIVNNVKLQSTIVRKSVPTQPAE